MSHFILIMLMLILISTSACRYTTPSSNPPSTPTISTQPPLLQKRASPTILQLRQELLRRELIRRIVAISKKNEYCGDRSALAWSVLVQTQDINEHLTVPVLAKLYRELKEKQAKVCQ